MLVMHGHGPGTRLGTCLCTLNVLWPLLHASMVMSFLLCTWFYYTNCAWAWTRQAPCALAVGVVCREFAACVNVWICWLCAGMDEASTLVRALCLRRVRRVSWVCNMCLCFNMLVCTFEYAGCAQAWTRHVPRYVPSVRHVCCAHSCVCDY